MGRDRFFLWLGAGVVTAGVTVGMLAGAGVAHAQTDDGDAATKTSQSANTTESKHDSSKVDTKQPQRPTADDTKPNNATTPTVKADGDKVDVAKANSRTAPRSAVGTRAAKFLDNVAAAVTHRPDRKAAVHKTKTEAAAQTGPATKAEPVVKAEPVQNTESDAEIQPVDDIATAVPDDSVEPMRSKQRIDAGAPRQSTVALARPMPAPAVASQPVPVPPVVSAIGTLVFGLISFAESVFEGPPLALPGSGVTVERSTLDLGNGHVVPADWYFPQDYDRDSAPAPERIIYLQHGFLARGVFYDYTASYLAEETNSVVVAPSLTSNIFATDGMWLGGDQMHRAVADLFTTDNNALLASARAAGYGQNQLPGEVVLIGHSLGGGLVIDTARYMLGNQASGEASSTLAGVVMLDGVSFVDPVPILEELEGVPVYNLSATPYFWNLFGAMDAALAQVRGDDFHGVQLLGGLHSDAMIGGNPLIQFGAYLLTGFSLPGNVEGSQILAAGWINDMFEGGDASGFYGEPGSTITIPTRFGPAFGLVQPQPGPFDTLARQLTAVFLGLLGNIDFATDVPAQEMTRNSVAIAA